MVTNTDLAVRRANAVEENVLLEQSKRQGDAFVASIRATVASSDTTNLHLKNPADSGLDANVQAVFVRTRFMGIVDVYNEFSDGPSGGTANGVDNLKMDTDGTTGDTSMAVKQDVTFTATNAHVKDVIPSGGPGGQVGGEATQTEPLIEPGREIVVEVTNESGDQEKAAISVVFVEEPRDE